MGVDLRAKRDTPVFAAQAGTVVVAKKDGIFDGYGAHVTIDHGNGLYSVYGHLDEVLVTVGQKVDIWQLIGRTGGNSKDYPKPKSGYTKAGFSTAYHLHYEIDKGAIGASYCINPTPITTIYMEPKVIEIPDFGKPTVEKCKRKGIIMDWTNPDSVIANQKVEWIFEKMGLLDPTKHDENGLSLLRLAIILDRAGLIDRLPDVK